MKTVRAFAFAVLCSIVLSGLTSPVQAKASVAALGSCFWTGLERCDVPKPEYSCEDVWYWCFSFCPGQIDLFCCDEFTSEFNICYTCLCSS